MNADAQIPRHFCQLNLGSGSCLAKLPPDASKLRRALRSFRQLFIVDARNPLVHQTLRSNAAILHERKRHFQCHHWFVIHPFSRFQMIWEMIVAVAWIVVFVKDPAMIAFLPIHRPFRAPMYHVFAAATDVILALYCFSRFITGKIFVSFLYQP